MYMYSICLSTYAICPQVLLDAPWESMGANDAFFEDSVAQVPPEAALQDFKGCYQ